jgi:hypothetical protein
MWSLPAYPARHNSPSCVRRALAALALVALVVTLTLLEWWR